MKVGKVTLIAAAILAAGVAVPSAAQDLPQSRTGQSEASLAGGTTIKAELNSSIDSKKAKAGDPVMAHTTEAVKSPDDRTILPKGTKLIGHVTQAAARSKGDNASTLGISFDKAVIKGGEEVPLNATIQALAAPANNSSNGPDLDATPNPSSPSNSPASAGGSNSGVAGSRSGRPEGTYPRTEGPGSNTSGYGSNSPQLAPNSRGVYGLNGLRLEASRTNDTQVSMITAAGKNVHLDSGTQLLLVTQTLASRGSGR